MKQISRAGLRRPVASKDGNVSLYKVSEPGMAPWVHATVLANSIDHADQLIENAWRKLKTLRSQTIDDVHFEFDTEVIFDNLEHFSSAQRVNKAGREAE